MTQINSNTKDDFQVVLLLSCFVGHPVFVFFTILIPLIYNFLKKEINMVLVNPLASFFLHLSEK